MLVSCIDPRLFPEDFFALKRTDCFVIRNAGGRAARAIPDLITLDQLAELKTVIVVHHTGTCRTGSGSGKH